MSDLWEAGQVIGGRYRLEAFIAAGATAQVWRAYDDQLRCMVAIKLLDPEHAGGGIAARLLKEARAAAGLQSLHVVQIRDYGMHEFRYPYLTMELLEGETLAQRLDRLKAPLPGVLVCKIMTHVGRAATKAHAAGIIHRDLNPQNIFLVRDDEEEVAKVFDFGIAKLGRGLAQGSTSHTAIGSLLGTPDYMSPEQARGSPDIDFKTDLWSLGIITFECVTGRMPFASEDLGELLEKIVQGPIPKPSTYGPVPARFDTWFAKAVQRDPARRFESAKVMMDSLREALLKM